MCSTIVSVGRFDLDEMKCYYLQVDMEYDNRKNCPHAVLNKLCSWDSMFKDRLFENQLWIELDNLIFYSWTLFFLRDLLTECEGYGGSLASPERDMSSILLVSKPEVMESELITKFLERQKIFEKLQSKCDSFSIEKCFPFTLFYYMERIRWFKLGESFVQDGFLSWRSSSLTKIDSKVHCTSSGEVFFQFRAEMVKIYAFEHWLFDKEDRFDDFKTGPVSKSVRSRVVVCLPKLGRGRIVKIHREIPENSPFSNYSQIKSYWKNTYGYILPSQEPCVYYDVLFSNGETMLYPFYCVLTAEPNAVKLRTNSSELRDSLKLFLADFERAMITITDVQLIPVKKDSRAIKRYMDVISMPPVNSSKIKALKKYSIKERNNEDVKPPKKVFPDIPTRKRHFEEEKKREKSPARKVRPGSVIVLD